jgi:LacI family gluconate utilization system Gnt-I transcriptional repressor
MMAPANAHLKKSNMKEVAKLAGVSIMTVSRVLHNSSNVRPETRIRVEKAIHALDYVPNLQAGALSSRHSHLIGALLPSLANSAFAMTMQGLTCDLEDAGYQIILGHTNYSLGDEEKLIQSMLGRQPEALAIIGTYHRESSIKLLKQADIPVVELWEVPDDPIDTAIGFSNKKSGHAIVQYLIQQGYRNIAFFGSTASNDIRGELRFEGYREAMLEQGLQPIGFNVGGGDDFVANWRHGEEVYNLLKAMIPTPDAIFCVSDILAASTIAACQRHGLCVPQDIAVAGHGDYEFASELHPRLTTVGVHSLEIGQRAARHILDRLHSPEKPFDPIIDLGFQIFKRESA